MLKQPDITPIDGNIDTAIRRLSSLPDRPSHVAPYVRLFVLRDDTKPVAPMKTANTHLDSKKQYITTQQILQIVDTTDLKERITALTPGLNATFERFEINTPLRITHFLAQVLHESGGFRWLREIWGPTDAQRGYEPPSSLARRLGNTEPGDGARYLGRGTIQLTGRYNYSQFSKAMGVDFVSHPEWVESAPYAVLVAGWYWNSRRINEAADRDDLLKVTRLVNGGTNGLADRQNYLNRAKQVLQVNTRR